MKNDVGERTLNLNGVIAEESWFGDEVTPQMFADDLNADTGDVTVWINSPGGDCYSAARIYNMMKEYSGKVTVKIDARADSAASVVAMAGDAVFMSPAIASMTIHNPMTMVVGNSADMDAAKAFLDEVKQSLINAYEAKTGLSRAKISRLMDAETNMSAGKAVALGFADGILYGFRGDDQSDTANWDTYSPVAVANSLIERFTAKHGAKQIPPVEPAPKGVQIDQLDKRLSLISH